MEAVSPPKVVVVGVGDELLFGQTTDTNGSWLAGELSSLGFQVVRRWLVADRKKEIQEAVDQGLGIADLVVLTGGLGPTPDDITRPSVAEFLGAPLREDPGLVRGLEDRARARGFRTLQGNVRTMAMVPEGGVVLPNPLGAAPGLVMECQGRRVVLLPGPPQELKALFQEEVIPFLLEAFGPHLVPVYHRVIHTTGVGESVFSEKMKALLPAELGPVSIAFLPEVAGVRIRLSVRGEAESEAMAWLDRVEEPLKPLFAPYRFEAKSGDLAEALGTALLAAGARVAVAESCTGGLLGKRLTDRPGSSAYFRGGIIAYDNGVKVDRLGISQGLLAEKGAVSRQVAEGMAEGVAGVFGTEAGIGITGIAGPDGGSPEKPVGTVWYAATLDGSTRSKKDVFPGDRATVRERGAQAAMALLFRMLRDQAG